MKTMTIKEIREWYSHRIEFTKRCLPELTDYIINEQKTIEIMSTAIPATLDGGSRLTKA